MSRWREYYILKYGDKFVGYAGYRNNKEFVHFELADKVEDADKFWVSSLHDMEIVKELMKQEIGIIKVKKAKYLSEVRL